MNQEHLMFSLAAMPLSFTENELNNIVYLGLKWACAIADPTNEVIATVIEKIGHNRSIENIVETTVQSARALTDLINIDFHTSQRKRRMHELIDEFCLMPWTVRNDLGLDKGYSKMNP